MITERLSFRAKYGHGDVLAQLFKESFDQFITADVLGARIYTDVTGPMFTVVAESDFADLAAYSRYGDASNEMYANPDFGTWFAKMMACTETGDRQLFNSERVR